jgi:nucleoside phosphorylase
MPSFDDYVIGWICALELEYAAAQLCLDETYPLPLELSAVHNDYTVGRTGHHHVVIAVPHHGPTLGKSSASTCFKELLSSFPNIRLVLSVGIGGGVPRNKDKIRLGDITVSAPFEDQGSIFQFDYESFCNSERLEITGIHDPPSRALRRGLSKIHPSFGETHLAEELKSIVDLHPDTRQRYRRPDNTTNACHEGPSPIIQQSPLSGDNPSRVGIHYGIIASASRQVDEASFRDFLSAKHDVLCFDSGAAGLMLHVPLLIVRGISDYSGEENNSEWRNYAALVAAIYTKTLLHKVAAGDVGHEMRVADQFEYTPIDTDIPSFRLINLLHSGGNDIHCEIFQGCLDQDDIMPYEALSYTWGSQNLTQSISVNGKTLYITANLFHALRYLRYSGEHRLLWIDAICIDQRSLRERGHQIKHMSEIFAKAQQVVFWLGEPTYTSDFTMDCLSKMQQVVKKHQYRSWKPSDLNWKQLWLGVQVDMAQENLDIRSIQRDGLKDLLSRPWFDRVWILQEVTNASKASVLCGTRSVNSYIFSVAPLLLGVEPTQHCQAVLDIMPGCLRNTSWWSNETNLYTLLLRFKESKAHDARDKVYALLAISADAQDFSTLHPDYTKSVGEVISSVAAFITSKISEFIEERQMQDALEELLDAASAAIESILAEAGSDTIHIKWLQKVVLDILRKAIMEATDDPSSETGLALLAEWYRNDVGTSTATVVEKAASDAKCGLKAMQFMFDHQGDDISITEDILIAAVKNEEYGYKIADFLLKERENEVTVTASILNAAVTNKNLAPDLVQLLLAKCGSQVTITETILISATGNATKGPEALHNLLRERGHEITITADILKAMSASNFIARRRFISIFAVAQRECIRFTMDALKELRGLGAYL